MPTFGYSTGAIAFADFRKALAILRPLRFSAVELSALREPELPELASHIAELDLSGYQYVSFHAPSSTSNEKTTLRWLEKVAERRIPIVVHPNILHDFQGWRAFGSLVLIENMDKRKPIGRTVEELLPFFDRLPAARFCLDIGHAKQVDPTLTEAYRLVTRLKEKLTELHVSEVNTESKHKSLTYASELGFANLAGLFPPQVAVVSEATGIESGLLAAELDFARRILFQNELIPA